MAAEDLIVGLDIGTTKVCVIIGQFNDSGQLEITGVGTTPSRGLRRGVVINIETTVRSIAAAVESAEMMSGRETDVGALLRVTFDERADEMVVVREVPFF